MTNDEARRNDEGRIPKGGATRPVAVGLERAPGTSRSFGLGISAFLRASSFVIRHSCPFILAACFGAVSLGLPAPAAGASPPKPAAVKIIFDTDIGNDVDDVLALSLLHALQSRGDCELLAVTITKPDALAGPFVDAINHFYGRPDIPIGFTHAALKNEPSKFLSLADASDSGKPRYPHRLKRSSDAPEATRLLRQILARQPDASVVMVQVGYFSNLAALLDTQGDGASPLPGAALVRAKVKLLSVMAGSFQTNRHDREFNVVQDLPAARRLAKEWPTPIVWSGFEIGIALPYPAISIERDYAYVPHHPAAEAYRLYNPPPHERPTWDLTSALYAVLPDRGYFGLSSPGSVTVEADGFTQFTPAEHGRDRYLTLTPSQASRTKEALVQLASQPPQSLPIPKGLHHSAQGCAPSATLGGRWVGGSTLKGLYRLSPSRRSIPHIIRCKGPRSNPFRVNGPRAPAPRVALGAQPWAERYNPFGIVYGVAFSADRMSKLQAPPARAGRGLKKLKENARGRPSDCSRPLTKSLVLPVVVWSCSRKRGHAAHSKRFASSEASPPVAKRLECGAFRRFGCDFVSGPDCPNTCPK